MAVENPKEESLKRRFLDISNALRKEYGYTKEELYSLLGDEMSIPSSVFLVKLPPLQAVVTYLKGMGLEYGKIAEVLHRSYRAVWGSAKGPVMFGDSDYRIPLSAFNNKLSVLETAVKHLKEHYELRYSKIGKLLGKGQRTVWTVYARAKRKDAK